MWDAKGGITIVRAVDFFPHVLAQIPRFSLKILIPFFMQTEQQNK